MIDLTEESYPAAMTALTSVARAMIQVANQIEVAEMRTICARFEALGPVLESTAFQRGGGLNLRDQAAFLKAVDEFVTALRKLDRRGDDLVPRCGTAHPNSATAGPCALPAAHDGEAHVGLNGIAWDAGEGR